MDTPTRQLAALETSDRLESLVSTHLDLVYTAALRQVGDPHLAADISQNVFLITIRKSPRLAPERVAGWLLVVTRYVALSALRAERRRRKHERAAVKTETVQPLTPPDPLESNFDEAMTSLGAADREIIILRFFRDHSIPQVASILGISHNTASKRVGRALQRLHDHLRRRGVRVTSSALPALIGPIAVRPAPKALAAQIIGASAAAPTFVSGLSPVISLMTFPAKLKLITAVAFLFLLIVGAYATVQLFSSEPATGHAKDRTGETALTTAFPNGCRIELVAICNTSNPAKWWSPDGSPLAQQFPVADFSALKDPFAEIRTTYQFAMRLAPVPQNPADIYLHVAGSPRTTPLIALRQDRADSSLFYGAARLYPEQPEAASAILAFSTLPWNKIVLDASGNPNPPLSSHLPPDLQYLSQLAYTTPFSRVRSTNGKTILNIGIEIWGGDCEFTADAIAKDGSSHPASNLLTGPITGGDNYNLSFDLQPNDIQHFEIFVREFDQFAAFAALSLWPGQITHPHPLSLSHIGAESYFDDAFYNQLFLRDFGQSLQLAKIPEAKHAVVKLIAALNARRTHLQAENSPDLYLIDKAVPILTQVDAALNRGDLSAANALLQADTASGRSLQYALQKLAQDR